MKRLRIVGIYLAGFLIPSGLYLSMWSVIGGDVMNRAGYWLWLLSGPDDLTHLMRIQLVRGVFQFATPLLLGFAGMGWLRAMRSRRAATLKE